MQNIEQHIEQQFKLVNEILDNENKIYYHDNEREIVDDFFSCFQDPLFLKKYDKLWHTALTITNDAKEVLKLNKDNAPKINENVKKIYRKLLLKFRIRGYDPLSSNNNINQINKNKNDNEIKNNNSISEEKENNNINEKSKKKNKRRKKKNNKNNPENANEKDNKMEDIKEKEVELNDSNNIELNNDINIETNNINDESNSEKFNAEEFIRMKNEIKDLKEEIQAMKEKNNTQFTGLVVPLIEIINSMKNEIQSLKEEVIYLKNVNRQKDKLK